METENWKSGLPLDAGCSSNDLSAPDSHFPLIFWNSNTCYSLSQRAECTHLPIPSRILFLLAHSLIWISYCILYLCFELFYHTPSVLAVPQPCSFPGSDTWPPVHLGLSVHQLHLSLHELGILFSVGCLNSTWTCILKLRPVSFSVKTN